MSQFEHVKDQAIDAVEEGERSDQEIPRPARGEDDGGSEPADNA